MNNFRKNYCYFIFGLGLISLLFRFGDISNYFWNDGGKYGIFIGFFIIGYALYFLEDTKKD